MSPTSSSMSHPSIPPGGRGDSADRERWTAGPAPGTRAGDPVPAAPRSAAQRWAAALQRARSDPGGEQMMTQLLEMVSWPELTDLPHALASPLTRICALLSYRRTAGLLVHRMLDMPREEVRVLLVALTLLGHVRVAPVSGAPQGEAAAAPGEELPLPPLKDGSILGKFWRRLTGRA